jgi:ERF superfamily
MTCTTPLLARHGLCILPRVTSRDVTERASKNGGVLFYVTVAMEFDFVAAEDASKHTVVMYGEAMDSGDKATNKAMSAAYKYACMQAFSIPTEGDNDADAQTHEVKPAKPKAEASPELLTNAIAAASNGVEAYKAFWSELTPADRSAIGESRHADFKTIAKEAVVAA